MQYVVPINDLEKKLKRELSFELDTLGTPIQTLGRVTKAWALLMVPLVLKFFYDLCSYCFAVIGEAHTAVNIMETAMFSAYGFGILAILVLGHNVLSAWFRNYQRQSRIAVNELVMLVSELRHAKS